MAAQMCRQEPTVKEVLKVLDRKLANFHFDARMTTRFSEVRDDVQRLSDPPPSGKSRLVVSTAGLNDQTARGMQEAVKRFAMGCYQAIRNPAAHEHGDDWEEQTALEYLAAFSVLARWIDTAKVEVP